jgi:hypothetical protein
MFELQRSTLNMHPLYFFRSDALSAFCAIVFFPGRAALQTTPSNFCRLRKHVMGLNVLSESLLRDEPLCQPLHLVGIIQSCVWLSCFTGYFLPGLISSSPKLGWLTIVLA